MRKSPLFLILVLFCSSLSLSQTYHIIEKNDRSIKLEFNFTNTYKLRDTVIESRVYQLIEGGEISARNPGDPGCRSLLVR